MNDRIKMITAMLIFGSIGVFVRNINLPSIEIAFLRAVIGSVFLISVTVLMRDKKSIESIKLNLILLIVSGLTLGFNWIMLFQAYRYTTIANATLSYYFAPIFVLLLSPIVLEEKLTFKKIAYVCMAMIGLFLILSNGQNSLGQSYDHLKGILYGLSGAVLYAGVILINKKIKNLSGYETTMIQLMVASIVLLPIVIYQNNIIFSQIDLVSWILILAIGIIHTGIAYLLYFSSIKELRGESIAILSFIDPIWAVIIAVVFLKEGMNVYQVIGGSLILVATFFSERKHNSN